MERIRQHPWMLVGLLCVAQIVVWTALPSVLSISLPLDLVTNGGIPGGREWQWGYAEHPPLPPWLMAVFFKALGDTGPFLLSQLAVAATYGFVFALGCELMAPAMAAAGTLLLTGVYYFSIPTPEFNHGIAEMLCWSAVTYFYYKAVRSERLGWWVGLGVAAGLGMLSKYSTAVLLSVLALYLLMTPQWRRVLRRSGPYLAFGCFAFILTPHVMWLVNHRFPTVGYFVRRAGHEPSLLSHFGPPITFLGAQALDIALAVAIAAFAGLLPRSFRPTDDASRFLTVAWIGPALLAAAFSLVSGMGLRSMWGMSMWTLTGLFLVYAGRALWTDRALKRIVGATVALFVILPLTYWFVTGVAPHMRGRHARTEWPDREIARTFANAWREQTGQPLQIVAGSGWLAGLISLRAESQPHVWIEANFAKAPWITPQDVARHGALVVWETTDPRGSELQSLPRVKPMGEREFSWPRDPGAPPLRIGWGILPPATP